MVSVNRGFVFLGDFGIFYDAVVIYVDFDFIFFYFFYFCIYEFAYFY